MPQRKKAKSKKPLTEESHDAKARIFSAAVEEFAQHGLAGSRTETIAKAAGVNIALVYYYFDSKEKLYAAVLEEMFSRWHDALMAPLRSAGTPKEKFMSYVEAYFDHAAESVWKPRLVQQELMHPTHSAAMRKMLQKYARPVYMEAAKVVREGIASGSFRKGIDVENFIYSVGPMVAHYFSHCSALTEISGKDVMSAECVKARRIAVLDIVQAALLANPKHSGTGQQK
jgi:TetR/AcrR family transcriptional regulator